MRGFQLKFKVDEGEDDDSYSWTDTFEVIRGNILGFTFSIKTEFNDGEKEEGEMKLTNNQAEILADFILEHLGKK